MGRCCLILLASLAISQNAFSCEEEIITEEEKQQKEVKSIQAQEEKFNELRNFIESLPEIQDLAK